jgi:hypothetical protein
VTISDKSRKRFEGVWLEFIRRELTVGNHQYGDRTHIGKIDDGVTM